MASRKAYLARNIEDVDAASPDDNDSLVWDAGASKWTPVAISGGGAPGAVDLPDLGDVTISDPQEGDILYYDAISGIWVNDRTAFAEIYTYNNTTATVVASGIIFTKFDQYQNDGLSQDNQPDSANNQIIFNKLGIYLVTLATSFETNRAVIDVEGGAFLDGVEQMGIQFRRYVSAITDEGAASAVGLINVTASGQVLDFRLKHDWSGDVDVTVTYANLTATHVVAAGGGGGGGVNTFLDLLDTPAAFATYSGAFVLVNPTEDALEFSHTVDYLDFNPAYQDGVQEGRLAWDVGDNTLELGMPGGNVKLQIGQEMHVRAKNDSGVNITNGQPVYVDGATGASPTVALARADDIAKAAIAIATEDIDDGQYGYVTTNGLVRDMDTSSLGVAGTMAWLADTPGTLQAFPAGGTSRNNVVGMVIKQDAIEGMVFVMSFIFNYINELSGVTILNPIEDDVLSWNAASGIWINKQGGGGGGHTIQYEGASQTQRTNLNFEGNAVTVLDDSGNDATKIIISLVSGILSQEVYETLTAQVVSGISHFSLSDEMTDDSLRVYYNGIRQQSNYFVVDSDNLGFTTAFVVEVDDEIFVDYEVITSGIGILDTYFTSLLDTPSDYTAASGLYLKVKDTEDGVEFSAVEEGGASAFTDLSDVPSSYAGQAGKHSLVNDAEDALEFVTISGGAWAFDDSTVTFGIDQDRNTGGSFAYQAQTVWITRPILLTSVLWDIRIADNYTLTVRQADETILATKYVASVGAASEDEEFALDDDLLLDPGYYRFRMTPDSSQQWSDKGGDDDYYFNTLAIVYAVDYGGTTFPAYRAPLKLKYYDSHTIAGVAGGGGDSTYTDPIADIPSPSNDGDLFLPNDGVHILRDTGAAWTPWGPLFPMVDPILGDFAWINQGAATVDDTYGGIFMTAPAVAGDQFRILKLATPSTPWTLTVALTPQLFKYNNNQCGIGYRQSSDGKLVSFTVAGNAPELVINKWNSPTSWNSGYQSINWNPLGAPVIWLRLEDDGVDRIMSWSLNGAYWTEQHSVGRTDFLTADEVFMYVDSSNATYPVSCLFLSWLLE